MADIQAAPMVGAVFTEAAPTAGADSAVAEAFMAVPAAAVFTVDLLRTDPAPAGDGDDVAGIMAVAAV